MENTNTLIEHNIQFRGRIEYFLCELPFIFYQISPVAVLMGTLLTLGIFAKHNELIAAMTGGVNIFRLCTPFFLVALAVSWVNFILSELIIPFTNQKVAAIRQTIDGINKRTTFAQGSIWLRDNMDIYSIKYIEPQHGVLKGLTIYKLDKDFNIAKRIDAKEAQWVNGRWIAEESRLLNFKEDALVAISTQASDIIPLSEKPEDLKNLEKLADEMNFRELWGYVERLKREGYTATRYVVDLHSKISFPLVSIIMVMLGIPFALKRGRRGGIAVGAGISIILGFSYWVISAVNTSLGYAGIIPPLLAAWFTNIIFAGLGLLMLSSIRQ
ncbi:MAG: LPS export ABC transporter permease LptG [Deltaproteobacteria bacterium]|nr:LPS export ABC transporter permease LptG [Deltaproteobacteria bacterium]